MAGKAILTCRPNSHPFQERTLTLEQPAKIGRSVARARSAPNNAIFDCKVLSRNHALFWYTNGKFYLQDTRSSNGTYVNNQRLSKSGEQSAPKEVSSGDIVQFGVNVLENSRKVTHGCIVANITLFLPDGKEAKPSPTASIPPSLGPLPVEELYLLNQYIQEAVQREQMLESKLISLQETLDNIRDATNQGWKALISEDRLLSRVQMLENLLQTYSKNFSEDNLREEVIKLQNDKTQYQTTTKDFLKKVLEEKLESVQKYQEIKRSFENLEEEYVVVCDQLTKSKRDINDIAQKLSIQVAKNNELEAKLQEIEEQHEERVESELLDMETNCEKLSKEEFMDMDSNCEKLSKEEFEEDFGRIIKGKGKNSDVITNSSDNLCETSESDMSDCSISSTDTLRDNFAIESVDDLKKSFEDLTKTNIADQGVVDKMKNCKEVIDFYSAQLNFLQESDKWRDDWSDVNKNGHLVSSSPKESESIACKTDGIVSDRILDSEISNDEGDTLAPDCEKSALKVEDEKTDANETIICELRTEDETNKSFEDHHTPEKLKEGTTSPKLNSSSNVLEDETSALKQQLMEAQQTAKQSRNEAAQMASKIEALTRELEMKNVLRDNKTKEELEETKDECRKLQETIESLHVQILSLKEEREKIEEEMLKVVPTHKNDKDSEAKAVDEACQELYVLNKEDNEKDDEGASSDLVETRKHLTAKILRLEEELVFVKRQYMACNEEKTRLCSDYKKLKADYEELTHQPYFNFIFSLPCIVLFLAVILSFYPTVSKLTGTSDNPDSN